MLAQQAGLGDADARSREPLFSVVAGFLLLGTLLWVIGHQYGTANIDKELEPLLKLTQLAGAKQTAKEITEAVGPDEKLFRELRGVLSRAGQFDLHDMVFNDVQQNWPENKAGNEDQMRQRLDLMQSIIQQARAQSGIGTSRLSGKDSNFTKRYTFVKITANEIIESIISCADPIGWIIVSYAKSLDTFRDFSTELAYIKWFCH